MQVAAAFGALAQALHVHARRDGEEDVTGLHAGDIHDWIGCAVELVSRDAASPTFVRPEIISGYEERVT